MCVELGQLRRWKDSVIATSESRSFIVVKKTTTLEKSAFGYPSNYFTVLYSSGLREDLWEAVLLKDSIEL